MGWTRGAGEEGLVSAQKDRCLLRPRARRKNAHKQNRGLLTLQRLHERASAVLGAPSAAGAGAAEGKPNQPPPRDAFSAAFLSACDLTHSLYARICSRHTCTGGTHGGRGASRVVAVIEGVTTAGAREPRRIHQHGRTSSLADCSVLAMHERLSCCFCLHSSAFTRVGWAWRTALDGGGAGPDDDDVGNIASDWSNGVVTGVQFECCWVRMIVRCSCSCGAVDGGCDREVARGNVVVCDRVRADARGVLCSSCSRARFVYTEAPPPTAIS
jgi:hypothetical protein